MLEQVSSVAIQVAIAVIVPILAKVVITFVKKGEDYLESKLKKAQMEEYNQVLFSLEKLTVDAVKTMEQTIVEDAKKISEDGKLNKEDAELVKEQAIQKVFSGLNDEAYKLLEETVDSTDEFVGDLVESKLHEIKNGIGTNPNSGE